jgi:hypothetical protein
MIATKDGVPGEYPFNLTPDDWWQWTVAPGCCELCLRLDSQLVRDLKPPLHPHCRCTVVRVPPHTWAPRPFRSFREKVHQAVRARWGADLFGLSQWLLVKAGLVQLGELIEGDRILDLAEVVAKKKLSVDQLVTAKVNPPVAAQAVRLARIRAAAAAKAKTAPPAARVEVPAVDEE